MTWCDMITLAVAAVAGFECVAGRLAALHWRAHRPALLLSYLVCAGVCILAGSMIWQRMDVRWLDLAAWAIAAHLLLSGGDWRDGPPLDAWRPQPQRYRPADRASHRLAGQTVDLPDWPRRED